MKLNRFCAKCGSVLVKNQITSDFLCHSCKGEKPVKELLPDKILLRKCVLCGAYSILKNSQELEWTFQPSDENDIDYLTRKLFEAILYKIEKKDKVVYELFLDQELNLQNLKDIHALFRCSKAEYINPLETERIIKIKEIHCDHCAKKLGGRFDSVLQIRIQTSENEDTLQEIMEQCYEIENVIRFNSPGNFISRKETTINGFNLKLSTNSMLKSMSNRLRAKYHFQMKLTKKLMGKNQENGSDLYRHYVLLKLVPVIKGDQISIENIEYEVRQITKNRISLRHLITGKVSQENFSVFEKKRWKFINNRKEEELEG